jgi:hypothetical protein
MNYIVACTLLNYFFKDKKRPDKDDYIPIRHVVYQ